MAEAHPVGFRWVIKARERGATSSTSTPLFSRTSAHADLWAPIRAGSDIAFFGGLINFVLSRDRVFRDYVLPVHERVDSRAAKTSGTPKTWMACSQAGSRTRRGRLEESWPYAPITGAPDGKPRRATRRCSIRGRSSKCFQAFRALYACYGRTRLRHPADTFVRDGRGLYRPLWSGSHGADLLRRWLDAAFDWRADHPRRGDPSAPARQHRPTRRRDSRAAWPCVDPGLDRHPDALRPASRLPADARGWRRRAVDRALPREASANHAAGGRTSTSTSSRC